MINTANKGHPHYDPRLLDWRFQVWKGTVPIIFAALYFYSISMANSSKHDDIFDPTSPWIIAYIILWLSAVFLPALAPKEARFMGSDISIVTKSISMKKSAFHRLFWATSNEAEINTILDERERALRHKALAIAYKMMPAWLGFSIGHIINLEPGQDARGIIAYLLLGAALHTTIPAIYLVWNYQPLADD